MLFTILAVGIGLIIALAGIIELKNDHGAYSPRATYAFSTAAGLALMAAPAVGII